MSVPAGVTLLLGGARSGKSTLAVELGRRWGGAVVFVATARLDADGADGTDDDLAARVARHRAERPAHWVTVETTDVIAAVGAAAPDALVIVDCVTLWIADVLLAAGGPRAEADAHELAGALADRPAPTVLVSNEVGLGVHPGTALGREYRDVLGRVNTTLAAHADRALFLVAGRAVALHDPWTLLA